MKTKKISKVDDNVKLLQKVYHNTLITRIDYHRLLAFICTIGFVISFQLTFRAASLRQLFISLYFDIALIFGALLGCYLYFKDLSRVRKLLQEAGVEQ
jgi:hypothetical protein